ncbi:MAG: hypothetical protein ACRELD_09325 [Longimicrobiales bacterium]
MSVLHRWTALGFVAALTACGPDLGLEGNVPLESAATQPPKPIVQQTVLAEPAETSLELPAGGVRLGEQIWLPTAAAYSLADESVRPVGTAGAASIYALHWDAPPYELLLVRRDDGRYQALAPVIH